MHRADFYLTQINPKSFPRSPSGTFKQSISLKMRLKIPLSWSLVLNKLLVAPVALTAGCSGTLAPASGVRAWKKKCANEGVIRMIKEALRRPSLPCPSGPPYSCPNKGWHEEIPQTLSCVPAVPPRPPRTTADGPRQGGRSRGEQEAFYGVKRPSLE